MKSFLYIIIILALIINCDKNKIPISYDSQSNLIGQLETDVAYGILLENGNLFTWGNNASGQLGNGSLNSVWIPTKVSGLENLVSINFTEGMAIAADISGNVWFWGDRLIWEEEPPNNLIVTSPTIISHLPNIVSIVVRGIDIDLLRADGTVWRLTWDHRSPLKFIKPQQILNLNNIKAISGNLALNKNGTIYNLSDSNISAFQGGYVSGIDRVIALQNVPGLYSILLKEDGTVWAWGRNKVGTLGDGSYQDSEKLTQTRNLEDIISISAEGSRCLALKEDGTVLFWGLIDLNL